MSVVLTLFGGLLAALSEGLGITACPGEWLWATTAVGALLGLSPVSAAVAVALIRHVTGNSYRLGTVAAFGLLGLAGALVPLLGFVSVTAVLSDAAAGVQAPGLDGRDLASLQDGACVVPSQADYLGGGRTVGAAVTGLPGPDLIVAGRVFGLLVVLPLLALFANWACARLAVRRGPRWPARLLWMPFLLLLLGTVTLAEGAVGQLWLGYVAVALPGTIAVTLVGRPRRRVIERTSARAVPPTSGEPVPEQPPSEEASHEPSAYEDPQYEEPQYPVTRTMPAPQTGAAPVGRLAADPGPLPAALAGVAPAPRPDVPGARFRRLRPLGGGGFGTVWLAHDTVLDRDVAVKVAKAADATAERRIQREARALAAVHHPHCVRVYDILPDLDGEPGLAIVMEYVPGRSLSEEVRQTAPLSDTAGAHLWSSLAGALAAAHARGVLHRDVTPSNVVVDPGGRAHLIDFGIARSEGDAALTATGIVIGTPDYLAPEVAAGGSADPGADAWQLAATVSFALTGEPPRGRGSDPVASLHAAASGAPLTGLPERSVHRTMLEQALQRDPARRPSLLTVQRELGRWLANTGRPPEGPVTMRLQRPDPR